MNIKVRQLGKSVSMIGAGNIVSKFSQYIILSLCTYLMSSSEYGLADICVSTASLLFPVVSLNVSQAVFRYSQENNCKGVVSFSLLISIFGPLVCFALAPATSIIPSVGDYWIFMSFLLLCESILGVFKEYSRGRGLAKEFVFGGLINSVFQILGCFVFIYALSLGVVGYVFGLCLGCLFEISFLCYRLRNSRLINFCSIKKNETRQLLKYCLPLIPNSIMWWIVSISDRYFILYMIGDSATGIYSVAARVPALISVVTTIFFKAWEMNSLHFAMDSDKNYYDSKVFNALWVATVFGISLLLISMRLLLRVLVSGNFYDAWKYSTVLVAASGFSALQTFFGTYYMIKENSIGSLKTTATMALINMVLNYVLIIFWGIQGATISTFISYLFVFLYRYIDTKKYAKIQIKWNRFILSFALVSIEAFVLPNCNFVWYYSVSIIIFIMLLIINFDSLYKFFKIFRKEKII